MWLSGDCQVNVKSQSELDIGGRETCLDSLRIYNLPFDLPSRELFGLLWPTLFKNVRVLFLVWQNFTSHLTLARSSCETDWTRARGSDILEWIETEGAGPGAQCVLSWDICGVEGVWPETTLHWSLRIKHFLTQGKRRTYTHKYSVEKVHTGTGW